MTDRVMVFADSDDDRVDSEVMLLYTVDAAAGSRHVTNVQLDSCVRTRRRSPAMLRGRFLAWGTR